MGERGKLNNWRKAKLHWTLVKSVKEDCIQDYCNKVKSPAQDLCSRRETTQSAGEEEGLLIARVILWKSTRGPQRGVWSTWVAC